MSTQPDAGVQMPGGSVADIHSNAQADNLQDADTLADMQNADPDMPDVRDPLDGAADNFDMLPSDSPIEDEDQLYNTSDLLDGGNNSSDLGAQAGLADTGFKGTDAGLDISAEQGSNPTGDRATGLSARD